MKGKSVDTPFLLVFLVLIVFGLLIFTSAALGLLARGGASFTSVAVSQLLLGFLCGGTALIFISRMDYRKWRPYTPYLFAVAILLTLLTFVPNIGLEFKGAARWIVVGPITFQPVELLKLATVAFLAAIYASRYKATHTLRSEEHTSELQSQFHLVCHFFFLNDAAPPEISPLPLHDALPIWSNC